MNEALIIVAVVAVVAIVVFFVKSRGRPSSAEVEERPAVAAAPEPAAPAREEQLAAAVVAEPAAEVVEEVAAEPAVPAKPKPSEGELKARVEASLGESKQMLDDLRQRSLEAEGMAQQIVPGTLEIMAEGLEEVEALAKKKQWSQAKDKADALEAQFRLLMQTASREKHS